MASASSAAKWLLLGASLLLSACASLPGDITLPAPAPLARPETSTLQRAYRQKQSEHPGKTGFRLLNNGVSALLSRAALIDLAEHTIDVQYYIFDADDVGSFLLDRLAAAAERGVRVRLLLDDYLIGFDDSTLARIDAMPNIEVRIFNPYRDRSRWSRPLQMLFNMESLGNRMHNKIIVVDGQIGVMGGRNISNHYFEGEGEGNFRDIDLLMSGPAARDAESIFDAFWNNPIVVPISAFGLAAPDDSLASIRERGRAGQAALEYANRSTEFRQRILTGEGMIYADGRAIGEPPVRRQPGANKSSSEVAKAMAKARQDSRHEATYAVAYFVPGERGVAALGEMAGRGVRVRILTNSLAATDVVAVHAGYAPYREPLVAKGVELYEYRPEAQRPSPTAGHRIRFGRSESALHAKIAIYDRRIVWVGSANFDPRSRHLNTEAGLLVDSPEIAARLLNGIDPDFSPQHSWRLTLEPDDGAPSMEQRLTWTSSQDGQAQRLQREPDAGFWRHIGVGLYSLIPGLEELL